MSSLRVGVGRYDVFHRILIFLRALLEQTGAIHFSLGNLVMIVIGVMIHLATGKHYESLLHVGTAFSGNTANVPGPPDVAGGHAISVLV